MKLFELNIEKWLRADRSHRIRRIRIVVKEGLREPFELFITLLKIDGKS